MKYEKKLPLSSKFLFRFTIWFFGLAFALVLLPQPLGQWLGGLSTDWISFSIVTVGVLSPVIYLFILMINQRISKTVLFPVIILMTMTMVLSLVDFGSGWGGMVIFIGLIIQGIAFISVILYSILILHKEKLYFIEAYLLMIVILNIGFVVDAAIIFYPEAYPTLPIYSLISYVLSWIIINIAYRYELNKHLEMKEEV